MSFVDDFEEQCKDISKIICFQLTNQSVGHDGHEEMMLKEEQAEKPEG